MNTKEKLIQLLELCIEKNLLFDLNPTLFLIYTYNKDQSFYFSSNYDGENKDFEFSNCIKIDDLITKVKNYQP